MTAGSRWDHRKSKFGLRHDIFIKLGNLALCHDEVRILIFDDPARNKLLHHTFPKGSIPRILVLLF
jgi:hypothetical protein